MDDDTWLADLAGDGSSGVGSSGDELETAVSESKPLDPDDLSDIPIWMLGGEQDAPVVETQASTDFETGELEDDTAVPTWLLSGDKTSEGTGALDESAPMDDIIPPSPPQQREKPQTILAGEELPDWLRQPESDEQDESAVPDPLSTDSMVDLASGDLPSWLVDEEPDVEARPIPEPDSDHDLYKDDINIPDWLMADFSTGQDQAEVSVTGDKNEREPIPPQESEEGSKSSFEPSDEDNLGWLEELAASEDEAESASYASRVAAGEGGAVDEPPTQVSMPEELPDFGAEPDAVGWPEKFKEPESEMEDVLAGVTGELNADLDWLDSLAEESADVVKLADAIESAEGEIEEFDSGTGWLDDLIIAGDTGPLDELGSEPILPDFEDSLGVLPEEPEDDLGWLSELEESADSTSEPAELIVDSIEFEETAVSPEPEPDDAVAWLDELAVESDDSLEDLMDLADESAIEELHVELETESVDAALDWLEITPDEADELEISEEPEVGLTEVTDLEDPITNEPPEDIDDAMAWLEELAAGQGALLEELPSMAEPLATEPEIEIPQAPVDSSPEWLDTAVDEVAADDIAVETGLETNISAITDPESAVEDAAPEDIDDAMAWVEGLAAKQGARLEELPSMADAEMPVPDATDQLLPEASDASLEWLEELAEDAVENGDLSLDLDLVDGDLDPVDASLDWLDETLETVLEDEEAPGQEMEEALEAGLAADAPGTMDDAMVWLDALAEEQEAPSEEMPESTDETDLPDFIDPLSDMAELETTPSFDDTPADLDDAMGWLEDLAAEQDSPLEDLPTIAGVVDEAIFAEPESETPPPPEPEAPVDELTEALDWLEQLALKDSGPKVELPVRETAVSDSENDLAEALDWLDQLAKPEEPPEEQTSGLVDLTDLTDEMPEDPDEALAWLQQVAAEQEEIDDTELAAKDEVAVDLVELPEAAKTTEPEVEIDVEPAVALEEPTESEIEDDILAEMPDDPDAAMAWLEQLAARQGAKLEELPTVSAEDMPIKVDDPDLEIEPEPSVDSDDVLLESEDEAASWLDDLMEQDEETAVEPTLEAAQDMDEPEDTDFPEADLTELEVPEDMDDAMAWLEALAVQQGAKLEELPTLSGTGEPSLESLDAADEDTAVVPEIEEITAEVEEAEAGMESSSDFSEIDEALIIPDEELTEDETFLSEGIEEDLPDWLDADTDALEAMPGQTQWLRELDEPDIDGWLNEEETTISSSYDRVVRSRFETPSDSAFETGSLSSLTDTPSGTDLFDLPDDEIETTVFDLDDEKLATARQAVENGVFDEAFQTYQILVDAGGGMMALIADLETIAVDHPDQPLFRHLLGDAYMRNGQLQKALDTYRVALDQI